MKQVSAKEIRKRIEKSVHGFLYSKDRTEKSGCAPKGREIACIGHEREIRL